MKTSNEPIKKIYWYEINQALIATGGRLLPVRDYGEVVRIDYEYTCMDAYNEFAKRCQTISLRISEKRLDADWRIWLRRFKLKRVESLFR